MYDRATAALAFITGSGWAEARRSALAGDASDRSYQRLVLGEGSAVFMDNPPGKADDPASFAMIDRHLRSLGLSAPEILAADLSLGFLMLEDLGDGLFSRVLKQRSFEEITLYTAATDILLQVQGQPSPSSLPDLAPSDWAAAATVALEWYAFAVTGQHCDQTDFTGVLTEILTRFANGPRVLILRDYHAENLIWLPDRQGLARVGLLDFQLAQMGQPAYDLVSLLQDARRDVGLETETAMIRYFAAQIGQPLIAFSAAYAAIGAQRALRILGIFARLCLVSGKPGYVPLIPRVWSHLQRNLAHPALSELRRVCDATLPEPTAFNLSRIERQCAISPFR